MKHLCILLSFFSILTGKAQEDKTDLAKEVVISGRVLNREVYPNEKTITLVIPYLNRHEATYTSPIADDDTFSFRFAPHAATRQVGLRNYAEFLFVHPGDSLFVEIDFNDIIHPQISETDGGLNRYMAIFTDKHYLRPYFCSSQTPIEEFEKELEQEYADRRERRADFLKKMSPGRDVEKLTADLLQIDYYTSIFSYAASLAANGKDVSHYKALLPKLSPLFSAETVYTNLFLLAEHVNRMLNYEHSRTKRRVYQHEDIFADCGGNAILPYIYLNPVIDDLKMNNPTYLTNHRAQFDSIVQASRLRLPALELYQAKVDYLKDPTRVSHAMLYGDNADEAAARQNMPFMIPIYDLLKKHEGKVVYIDFWGVTCPPCLAEMEPLKEMRKRYSPQDVVMVSICGSRDRVAYQKILDRFALEGKDIECIFSEDWATAADYRKIMRHWQMNSIPQYVLFNRHGVIVNYGTALRPTNPLTAETIDALK